MNEQTVADNWNEIKGKLRQRWGQLTDDDLPQIRGDLELIIGAVQRKTGEAREAIAQYLHEVSGGTTAAINTAAGTVSNCAQHAADAVQHSAKQATDHMGAGYDEAQQFVRDRPGTSLALCFGVGVITGIIVAVFAFPMTRPETSVSGRAEDTDDE